MQSLRRENIAIVPGYQVWRQRVRLPLTPRAVKAEMVKERRIVQTPLDKMLTASQADILERWAMNEQVLSGKAPTQSWGNHSSRMNAGEFSPISDHRIEAAMYHSRIKKGLDEHTLEVLSAFVAIQNRHTGALSAAQYGIVFCPKAKNKSQAFFAEIREAADLLASDRY